MLIQPILYNVAAFDATHSQVFKFFVNGGDLVTKNKLIIKTNDTEQETVYDEEITTYDLWHTLPANTLTNGLYYQATVITYNSNGESSAESLPIQFYCYTQPSFDFINLPTGNIVEGSNYTFQVQYNQDESEPLSQYNFSLYDISNNLVATSGNVYTGVITVPLIISYLFDGFLNGETYRLVVTGQTSEGTLITTQTISISIAYDAPEIFSPIYVTNNCDGGYISVQSNLILIDGAYSGDTPTYIDNSAIDLTNGDSVIWNNNIEIPDNYSVVVWGKDFINGEDIVILKNDNNDIVKVKYMEDNGQCWFELFVYYNQDEDAHVIYECMSNLLTIPQSDYTIIMAFRCVDCLYDIWCNMTE